MTKAEIAAKKAEEEKLAAEKLAAENEAKAKAEAEAKPKEKVYTSEKLVELEAKAKALKIEGSKAMIEGNDKIADEKFTEAWKVGEEIKKEIAAIKQHDAELARKEKEAATVKLLDDVLETYVANQSAIGNDSLTLDEKNALNDAYQKARQIVVNRLLGSVPKVKVEGTTSTGAKGANGKAVREAIEAGKTKTQMMEDGLTDGTIRSEVWKMNTELKGTGTGYSFSKDTDTYTLITK